MCSTVASDYEEVRGPSLNLGAYFYLGDTTDYGDCSSKMCVLVFNFYARVHRINFQYTQRSMW